ncbi:MAG: VPLPA-CTERM sorting domain-containing protein [Rhodobacteraceae bacterium]|nr:MAG: VPLPA-CTERM sorting domain-containing protein [Paracoccaceae bacterium]
MQVRPDFPAGGALTFQNAGGDNIGAILTSVKLTVVPLPAGLPLLLTALGGLGLMVRRKRKAA